MRRADALALALALILTGTQAASADADGARRFVAPHGSDAGPGTRERPWRTLEQALDELRPGQTAYVRAGTYPDFANFVRSGSPGAPITIRNFPGERPLVTGRLRIRGDRLTVSGLHFRGRTPANPDDYLIYLYGGDHVVIAGNELERGYKSAIYVGEPEDPARDLRLVRNWIHHNGQPPERRWLAHGLYCGHCRGGVVANNVFDHNLAWNLQMYPDSRDVLITQNTIVHAGASGIMVGGDAESASHGVRITNNIIAFNHDWGVQSYAEGGPTPTDTLVKRNLFFGNGDDAIRDRTGGLTVQGSLFGSPRFRGPGDYRLRKGSAAIDMSNAPVVRRDYDGRRRPRGRGTDVGAFER